MLTAEHKVLDAEQESGLHLRCAVAVQDLATQWIHSCPRKIKSAPETMRILWKILHPEENPRSIYTGKSLEHVEACEEQIWNHERSTPRRSETHGTAERAARRVKEGTSSVLVLSGLQERLLEESMECCCCYLRKCAGSTRRWPDTL